MRSIVSEYGGAIVCGDSSVKIGKPMIQYEETDWEFCKRLAGNLALLPQVNVLAATYAPAISERIFCDNCKVLVDMFEREFPNIKVIRVEVVK